MSRPKYHVHDIDSFEILSQRLDSASRRADKVSEEIMNDGRFKAILVSGGKSSHAAFKWVEAFLQNAEDILIDSHSAQDTLWVSEGGILFNKKHGLILPDGCTAKPLIGGL